MEPQASPAPPELELESAIGMPGYIVIPDRTRLLENLTLAGARTGREARHERLLGLKGIETGGLSPLLSTWLQDQGRPEAALASAGVEDDVAFVNLEANEATQLQRDVPSLVLIRNERLPLIRPTMGETRATAWHLEALGLATKGGKRKGAWTGENHLIAVCDTGIDAGHPVLQGKVEGTARVDLRQRRIRWSKGSRDTAWHGTHVAGLICGTTVGVAPGSRVVNVQMLPGGEGDLAHFVLALKWIANNPEISIVNISAGLGGYVEGLRLVLRELLYKGVLPVVAVGNEGADRTRSPGNYVDCLSVGAATPQRKVWTCSGGGTMVVDHQLYRVPRVVAPGVDVLSCIPGGGMKTASGSSMAAPIVSGLAALMLERHGPMNVLDLKQAIEGACMDLDEPPERQGAGLVRFA